MITTSTAAISGSEEQAEGATLRERKKQQTRRALHIAALSLVEENGLEGTTVEQICHDADVSPRTFFNYFPTKAAAALNLPESVIAEDSAVRFRSATGDLVPALCDLLAGTADLGADRHRMKDLITRRPELLPAFTQWMGGVRGEFVSLAEERTADHEDAVKGVTLVMAGLGFIMHNQEDTERPIASRLLEAIDALIAMRSAALSDNAADAA